MRLSLFAVIFCSISACTGTKLPTKTAAPQSKVVIYVDSEEKYENERRIPTVYLSKVIQKKKNNGALLYRRSGHHALKNGLNFLDLEQGATYAVMHIKSPGPFGLFYVVCGKNNIPAFTVAESTRSQIGPYIEFKVKRRINRIQNVNLELDPAAKKLDRQNFSKSSFINVMATSVMPESECDPVHFSNADRYKVPSYYSLVELQYRGGRS